MLGWSITIYRGGTPTNLNRENRAPVIVNGLQLLHVEMGVEMRPMTQISQAADEVVCERGGYPNIYRVQANNFPHEALGLDPLSAEPDELVYVVMWDQS